ncbi:MAG TPA: tetratricopeptide repeat protein [Polyangiaceae bacterium]|nr:tetratricopeptide repeat protein [Polyangiaceae bacterium]
MHPDAAALSLLGKRELKAGRFAQAAAALERAVALQPNAMDWCNLGVAYFRLQELERAARSLQRALALDANQVDAHWNLGLVLIDAGELEQGLTFLSRAVALRPASVPFRLTLANVLLAAERSGEAVQHFREALRLEPKNVELPYQVLATLTRSECLEQAEQLARSLVDEQPASAERQIALGRVLTKGRRFSEAIAAFQRALALAPTNIEVTKPLVEALAALGHVDETITELQRALAIDPSRFVEHSSLVFQTMFSERYDSEALLVAARRWSDVHAAPLAAKRRPHSNARDPERRLRVGYVSPDFRKHVQRLYTIPVLSHHDHAGYEIVCYSSVKAPDSHTERIAALADEWHDVAQLSDAELAQKIRDDRIDVLVDLTMHMTRNRLRVFAEKPAPVQIAWLAYPGTTGVDGMDYRLTDPYLDPPGASLPYSERSLWLPYSFWCYGPEADEIAVGALPCGRAGYVTFGCLNNFMKVSCGTLELWAKVMRAVTGSRLLLLAPHDARDSVLGILREQGVGSERVEFVDQQPRERYLETYQRIDIALDTLPYQGHTTSLDAYWMGVPVITLVGKTIVGRAGLSLANNLKLSDWVAHTADEFVRIAGYFAADPARLAGLRTELRQRLQQSPLMDAARFTRDLEGAYRTAWRTFCAAERASTQGQNVTS